MALTIPIFWKIFIFSLSAVPVSMSANKMLKYLLRAGFHSGIIAIVGIATLTAYVSTIVLVCRASLTAKKIHNPHFYVFSLFAFTSVIDMGIGLELNGYISEFLTEYLKSGEPYLMCPYGGMICYFDGVAMYLMYLVILYSISNNKSYRSVGLYWAGTLINSMIVLLLGILLGKHGVFPATSLNIPYLIFPVVVTWQLLQNRPKLQIKASYSSLTKRPLDVFLIIGLVIVIAITLLRGLAVLDDKLPFVKLYLHEVEPILVYDDPCPFIKVQMLLYLFYFIPFQVLGIHGLITPGCSWMQDVVLIYAGATAQGQFSHMLTAVHREIPENFRVPDILWVRAAFWTVNLIFTSIPHLLLIRCLKVPEFFSTQIKSNSVKRK